MKKTIIVLISVLAFSACSTGDKWDQSDPDMPEELRQRHQEILDENLQVLPDIEDEEEKLDVLLEIGYRYHQLGDYRKAEEYYQQILEIDEKYFPALNNLAEIYEEVEEYDKAADLAKKMYSWYPDNSQVIIDVVRILLKADMPDTAQEALDNFIEERADKPEKQEFIDKLQNSINNYLNQ